VQCGQDGVLSLNLITYECDVRQRGVLSSYMFVSVIYDIIREIKNSEFICKFKHENVIVGIFI